MVKSKADSTKTTTPSSNPNTPSPLSPTPPLTPTSSSESDRRSKTPVKAKRRASGTSKNKKQKLPVSLPISKQRKKPREIIRMGNKCFLVSKHILREIREYRNFTSHVIPRAPFAKVVREIMTEYLPDSRIQSEALECLQEAAEAYITQYLEDSNCCAAHSRRITLMPKDMELVRYLRGTNL